jgi:prefoldin subunit 5
MMADIQATLLKMSEQLGRLEKGMESLQEQVRALRNDRDKHNERIDTLEKWRVKIASIGAVVGSAFTMIISWAMKKFGM